MPEENISINNDLGLSNSLLMLSEFEITVEAQVNNVGDTLTKYCNENKKKSILWGESYNPFVFWVFNNSNIILKKNSYDFLYPIVSAELKLEGNQTTLRARAGFNLYALIGYLVSFIVVYVGLCIATWQNNKMEIANIFLLITTCFAMIMAFNFYRMKNESKKFFLNALN